MLNLIVRQRLLQRSTLTAVLLFVVLMLSVIISNQIEMNKETHFLSLENERIEADQSIYFERASTLNQEKSRLESLLSQGTANPVLQVDLDRIKAEMETTVAMRREAEELYTLNQNILDHVSNTALRFDAKLERLRFIVERTAETDRYQSDMEPLYYVFLRESRDDMKARLSYYERILEFNEQAADSQQQTPMGPTSWTGSKTLTTILLSPLNIVFIAFTSIIPAIWIARLFETDVVRILLLSSSRRRLCVQLIASMGLLWAYCVLLILIVFGGLSTLINGFGSLQHVILHDRIIYSFREVLSNEALNLTALSLQLTTVFALISVRTRSAAAPPLLLIIVTILNAVRSYLGKTGSTYTMFDFFNVSSQRAFYARYVMEWFLLTILTSLILLWRHITCYEMKA